MHDGLTEHLVIAIDNLVHNRDCLSLRHILSGRNKLGEISSFAKFGDDVGVVLGGIDVVKFYYVLVVFHEFEHFDF
jgi:hypothetical protein